MNSAISGSRIMLAKMMRSGSRSPQRALNFATAYFRLACTSGVRSRSPPPPGILVDLAESPHGPLSKRVLLASIARNEARSRDLVIRWLHRSATTLSLTCAGSEQQYFAQSAISFARLANMSPRR